MQTYSTMAPRFCEGVDIVIHSGEEINYYGESTPKRKLDAMYALPGGTGPAKAGLLMRGFRRFRKPALKYGAAMGLGAVFATNYNTNRSTTNIYRDSNMSAQVASGGGGMRLPAPHADTMGYGYRRYRYQPTHRR